MIVRVYPVRRLPRKFGFFDYSAVKKIPVGSIVSIPFKGQTILGVVKQSVPETDNDVFKAKRKPIKSVLYESFFQPSDVLRIESIARNLIQSPANLFVSALMGFSGQRAPISTSERRPLAALSIDSQTARQLKQVFKHTKDNPVSFAQLGPEGQYTLAFAWAKTLKQEQLLILVPTQPEAEKLLQTINFPFPACTLHGKTSINTRSNIIKNWQNGHLKILISTRQGVLLPAQRLSAVLVLNAHNNQYERSRQNPRFDVRGAGKLLAQMHGARYIETGPAPRLLNQYRGAPMILDALPAPKIVDMRAGEEKTKMALISQTLLDAITFSLKQKKQVLLVYNKKGVADTLQCSACGHIPFCGICGATPIIRLSDLVCPACSAEMWIPKECPACKKQTLKERGIGNKRLALNLKKKFPGATVSVLDKQTEGLKNADILLVTQFYFEYIACTFKRAGFGIICDVSFDRRFDSSFDSEERACQGLYELMEFAKHEQAPLFIQTWIPELLLPMQDLGGYLAAQNAIRAKYELFPYYEGAALFYPSIKPKNLLKSKIEYIAEKTLSNPTKSNLFEKPNNIRIETTLRNYDTPSADISSPIAS